MFLKKILSLKGTLLFRLTILYAVVFMFSSLITFLIYYHRIYTVNMERMDLELVEEIEKYAADMTEKGLKGLQDAIAEESESEDPDEEFYRLIDFEGHVLASTDMSSWGVVDQYDALARLQRDETSYVFHTMAIPDHEYKARMISAVIGPNTIFQIGETLEDFEEYLEIFRNLFAILIFVIMAISVIIGWFLARRALIDMEEVTLTAEEISKGAYDRRVEIKGRFEEVKRLAATFNKMLDRIQNLLKSMKDINDNIAHDLRSPVARIRGIAEMTLAKEQSIDDYKNMAISTMEECDSLIDLINTMLDITEAEAGVNKVKVEEFDLVTLILDACELFRMIAYEKKIDLKVSLPETLAFRGDRKKMQRIVTNVLENALKYTPERGTVTVSATAHDGKVQIVVEDTGKGITEADLPHIFERFYRCDRSRPQGGVGLGLSLAKVYTESMNGLISVNSTLNQGSIFTLSFSDTPF